MKYELAKGVRDFPPEEQILRQELMNKIKTVFERYGYSPLETPILERLDTLTAKFGAGDGTDVMNEIFKLNDQGNRVLGLKFDQTVPLARYISQNPTIKLPFKRYVMDRAFRDGPIKLGRYREFLQCDVDIVGCRKMTAEAELMHLTIDVFKELGLSVRIEINNRKLLYGIMKEMQIPKKKQDAVAIVIDKIKKAGSLVKAELEELGVKDPDELLRVFQLIGKPQELVYEIIQKYDNEMVRDAGEDLLEIFSYSYDDISKIDLNLGLARGLSYYTGTVYEVFLTDSKIKSSVAGGGRYDNMISEYAGRGNYPAIGISFGLAPIIEAIKLAGYDKKLTVAQILVIPINKTKEAMQVAKILRDSGIKTDIDLNQKGISKNLDFANHYKIPYVAFVGEEEINKSIIKLRNMNTGDEKQIPMADIPTLKLD